MYVLQDSFDYTQHEAYECLVEDDEFEYDLTGGLPSFIVDYCSGQDCFENGSEFVPYDILDAPVAQFEQTKTTEAAISLPEPSVKITDEMLSILENLLTSDRKQLEDVNLDFINNININPSENNCFGSFVEPIINTGQCVEQTSESLMLTVTKDKNTLKPVVESFTMHKPQPVHKNKELAVSPNKKRGRKRKAAPIVTPDGKYIRKTKTRPPIKPSHLDNLYKRCHGWKRFTGCVPSTVTNEYNSVGKKHYCSWYAGVYRMRKHLKEFHGFELHSKLQDCTISVAPSEQEKKEGKASIAVLAKRLICLQSPECEAKHTRFLLNPTETLCDTHFLVQIDGKTNYENNKAYVMHLRTVHNVTQIRLREEK